MSEDIHLLIQTHDGPYGQAHGCGEPDMLKDSSENHVNVTCPGCRVYINERPWLYDDGATPIPVRYASRPLSSPEYEDVEIKISVEDARRLREKLNMPNASLNDFVAGDDSACVGSRHPAL